MLFRSVTAYANAKSAAQQLKTAKRPAIFEEQHRAEPVSYTHLVIAVCGNVGQKGELEGLEERAKASGASKLYVEDLTDEFVEDYVIPTMQAGADYEGYLLGTSFARPILAKRVVEIARAEGADAVCHGSTGKGNDQVRFELAIMHFAPDLKIITPWREWDIQSRDEEIDYAEAHHLSLIHI